MGITIALLQSDELKGLIRDPMPNGCKDYFHFFPWILHVHPPLLPPRSISAFAFRGRVVPSAGEQDRLDLGSILVISTKINTSLLGVRFIDPAAWVDLSPGVGSAN